MNPLATQLNVLVWHRTDQMWGHYIGPDPANPGGSGFVVWGPGDDPVSVAIDDLLVSDHPSAGQVDRPAPDAIGVRVGMADSPEPTEVLWYVPGRRPENRRTEAFSFTQKLVGAGLFDWAEVIEVGARTERSGW